MSLARCRTALRHVDEVSVQQFTATHRAAVSKSCVAFAVPAQPLAANARGIGERHDRANSCGRCASRGEC